MVDELRRGEWCTADPCSDCSWTTDDRDHASPVIGVVTSIWAVAGGDCHWSCPGLLFASCAVHNPWLFLLPDGKQSQSGFFPAFVVVLPSCQCDDLFQPCMQHDLYLRKTLLQSLPMKAKYHSSSSILSPFWTHCLAFWTWCLCVMWFWKMDTPQISI